MKIQNSFVATGTALCLGIVMAGCGSDGGSSTSDPVALKGTAAIGAPVANGTVALQCGDAETITTTANALGVYQVLQSAMTAKGAAFPCAIKVSGNAGGQAVTLFSFADSAGVANITPLTDLAVAHMANSLDGRTPAEIWFGPEIDAADLPTREELQAAYQAAQDAVETAVASAADEDSLPFDIFTQQFAADGQSVYDRWLDSFNEALADAGQTYGQVVTAFVSGSSLGNLTITIDASPVTGGGNKTLTVKVEIAGYSNTVATVTNTEAPANNAAFCGWTGLEQYQQAGFTVTNCTYSNGVGVLSGTVQGMSYKYTYTWS